MNWAIMILLLTAPIWILLIISLAGFTGAAIVLYIAALVFFHILEVLKDD